MPYEDWHIINQLQNGMNSSSTDIVGILEKQKNGLLIELKEKILMNNILNLDITQSNSYYNTKYKPQKNKYFYAKFNNKNHLENRFFHKR